MSERQKKVLTTVLKVTLAIVIVASIGKVLSSYIGQVDFSHVNMTWLALAFLLTLAYRITNAYGWTFVLGALNVKLSGLTAVRIWITSEACRWLPGSLWSYGSRALQAKKNGVPAVTAGASLLLEMLLTIGAWSITTVVGLAFYRKSFMALIAKLDVPWESFSTSTIVFWSIVLVAVAALLVFTAGRLKAKFAAKWEPIKSRLVALRSARPNPAGCAKALGYYVVMCMVNGVAATLVFRAVLPDANVPMLAIVGANAAAWLIGFFAIMAPGGLVVREGAMATLLVAWLPAEQAIAAAVIWRFVQIVVEATCMVGVYAEMHLSKRLRRLPATR